MNTKRVNTKKMRAWTGIALVLAVLSALCLAAAAETAEDWYKKGRDLAKNGSYEEAVEAHDEAIEIEPQNATFWLAKGQVLRLMAYELSGQERTETEEAAISAYEKATEINPNYLDAWISMGFLSLQIAIDNSKSTIDLFGYNESLKFFDKAIELNPNDSNAWRGKGSVFLYLSQYEDAVKAYDMALKIDPSNIGASQGKGTALANLGEMNESAKTYENSFVVLDKAIEVANSTEELSEAWLGKGFALQEQGKYEDAVKALGNATDADPKNEMAWKVKGVLLWRELKKYDEAVDAFDKALQINPKDSMTWMNKGDALKALGRQAEADEAYAKARELGYQG